MYFLDHCFFSSRTQGRILWYQIVTLCLYKTNLLFTSGLLPLYCMYFKTLQYYLSKYLQWLVQRRDRGPAPWAIFLALPKGINFGRAVNALSSSNSIHRFFLALPKGINFGRLVNKLSSSNSIPRPFLAGFHGLPPLVFTTKRDQIKPAICFSF